MPLSKDLSDLGAESQWLWRTGSEKLKNRKLANA
jgi:hypothetical protein